MDDVVRQAFTEETVPLAAEIEARLLEIERKAGELAGEWRALLGVLHTVKGNCGMVGLDGAQDLAHAMEQRAKDVRGWAPDAQARGVDDLLRAADRLRAAIDPANDPAELGDEVARVRALQGPRDAPAAEPEPRAEPPADGAPAPVSHVRIAAARLDRLLDVVGDLVAWHARLRAATPRDARAKRRRGARDASPWAEPLEEIDRRLAELRGHVMDLRLVPLSMLLGRFDRLVRDLGRELGKPVALTITGGELAVDKHVVDHLAEPLLHVVRNAIDHGVEPARARAIAGKPERGTIAIEAHAHGGVLTLSVRDDGRGIDPAKLVAAAARHGVNARAWTPEQILELVFLPELSTAERVTHLSGRGVGLDQARRALERIGGSIQIRSELGAGTELVLRVPMVIAVQRSLLVRCGAEVYGIPFTSVIEAFRVAARDGGAVPWRGHDLPTCELADEIGGELARGAAPSTCVVLDAVGAPIGVMVDDVLGHEDLTIRELDPVFGRPRSVTGASLLADGRIVPVLDLQGIGRARAAGVGGTW